jgi:hypothetical protein
MTMPPRTRDGRRREARVGPESPALESPRDSTAAATAAAASGGGAEELAHAALLRGRIAVLRVWPAAAAAVGECVRRATAAGATAVVLIADSSSHAAAAVGGLSYSGEGGSVDAEKGGYPTVGWQIFEDVAADAAAAAAAAAWGRVAVGGAEDWPAAVACVAEEDGGCIRDGDWLEVSARTHTHANAHARARAQSRAGTHAPTRAHTRPHVHTHTRTHAHRRCPAKARNVCVQPKFDLNRAAAHTPYIRSPPDHPTGLPSPSLPPSPNPTRTPTSAVRPARLSPPSPPRPTPPLQPPSAAARGLCCAEPSRRCR